MNICQIAGLRIRKTRIEMHMTIDELAEKCDVSTQTIKIIESGKRNFKIKTLYTIANALCISSDYIIGCIDTPFSESMLVEKTISQLSSDEIEYFVSILTKYIEILKK